MITRAALLLLLCMPAAGWAQSVWPMPKSATFGSTEVAVRPSSSFFVMKSGQALPHTLEQAFLRYHELTFPHRTAPADNSVKGGAPAVTPP